MLSVYRPLSLVTALLALLVWATACQPPLSGGQSPTPTPAAVMNEPPATQWSDVSTPQEPPTLLPTETAPVDFEPTAAAAGKTPYSGYNCSITADACACDEAVVIKAGFSFPSSDTMLYEFRGDTYGAQWQMSRVGPNQWSYIIPIGADQSIGTAKPSSGHFFILLTFTSDGFTLLQREEYDSGAKVTCPEVAYTRLSAVTPGP